MGRFTYPVFDFKPVPGQLEGVVNRHSVVVIGAGPVGLAVALDLAQRGHAPIVLDDDDTVSIGSRAVNWSRRGLEIMDRLGCGPAICDKGVPWSVGRIFLKNDEIFRYDLQSAQGHKMPVYLSLQQYYFELFAIERFREIGRGALRFQNRLTEIEILEDGIRLTVETPQGPYHLITDWLLAADGTRSSVRRMLGLEFVGRLFEDRFLIADVRMESEYPMEHRFWFDPPFHSGHSASLQPQADMVWRIDLQLGWASDPVEEELPENVRRRLSAMLGPRPFEIEWSAVYTYQCRRMERFRHGQVIFLGDSAHQVSPFGARGGNSGLQDAENLAWKLDLILKKAATGAKAERLLESYNEERVKAAEENLLVSTRSTEFISPKGAISHAFRDAVLGLARDFPFARSLVNSGRLGGPDSTPSSDLNTPDRDAAFSPASAPGAFAEDAPITSGGAPGWLSEWIGGGACLLLFTASAGDLPDFADGSGGPLPVRVCVMAPKDSRVSHPTLPTLLDREGLAWERYDAQPGTCYLIRPDGVIAGRWRQLDRAAVATAVRRLTGERAADPA